MQRTAYTLFQEVYELKLFDFYKLSILNLIDRETDAYSITLIVEIDTPDRCIHFLSLKDLL